jgi:hypothetical protein
LTPWPTDQTVTLDGERGLAWQNAIRCPSGDHCMMLLAAARGMCAKIRPDRLFTTTRTASLLPPGPGSADSWTGVPGGKPTAPLSSAAVTMVRAARPGPRNSMALSGAVSGP